MQATLGGTRYEWTTTLRLPVEAAVKRVREALEAHGFSVLSQVDLAHFLARKLRRAYRPLFVLEAYHPELCHAALQVEPSWAPLVPCTVVVREQDTGSEVLVRDEEWAAAAAGSEAIRGLAVEENRLLRWALETL